MALNHESIVALIYRQLRPTIARVNGMIKRGVIRRVNDGTGTQTTQLSMLADETADDVEHMQPFGLSFAPPVGAEVVALAVGGNADHLVALAASSRAHRPTGAAEGEGGLYTLDGWRVYLDRDGNVFLGGGPDAPMVAVALATKVEAELEKVRAALASASAPPSGGAVTYGAPYTAVGAVGSSKVRAVE